MQQGTVISAAGHVALIALAIFGLPERRADREISPAQVTDVSIVSLEAFQAAQSSAPEEAEETPEMTAPVADSQPEQAPVEDQMPVVPPADVPDAPSQDTAPDASGLAMAVPDVATEVDAPEAEVDAGRIGLDAPLIDAAPQDGSVNSTQTAMLTPERPNAAPRIDTSAAPKPPEPVREAPEVVPDTSETPSEQPVEEAPEDAAAPEAATVETVPDAVEEERPTTPAAATRPRGRPATLAADAEKKRREAEAQAAAEAERKQREEAEAAAIAEALAAAQPEAAPDPAPQGAALGRDFNSSQRQAVGDAIGGKWNKTLIEGKDNFEDLVIVVRVRMTAAGKVMGGVEPVEPSSPQGDYKVAYDAARRAILRAQPIPLPQDLFRDGDYLEIRFDPGRGAISLD